LKSDLAKYNVPITDVPKIAGGKDAPDFLKIVKLLEGLYPDSKGSL
jgi:hypothetical protein